MELSCQRFSQDLLNSLCKDGFDKNVIYSPLSVYMALGMTLSGAQGETLTQMMSTLYWDNDNSQSFHNQLSNFMKSFNVDNGAAKIANKLFLENKFNLLESFVTAMDTLYNGSIEKMDFQDQPDKSRQDINKWVEQTTNGKIIDLLAKGLVKNYTKLILVNAVYFKGRWMKEFSKIGDQSFHLLNGGVKVKQMMQKTSYYKYLKNSDLNFSAVQIPFEMMNNTQLDEYSLMIVLPHNNDGLEQIEKHILHNQWNSVLRNELFEQSNIHITMPKFRVECSFDLKDQLITLGMTKAFTAEADFSLMTGNKDLFIDKVIHKAFIDIDEIGVEAAAATAVLMMPTCAAPSRERPIEFRCDHPFMFALLKNNSLPLFLGHFLGI